MLKTVVELLLVVRTLIKNTYRIWPRSASKMTYLKKLNLRDFMRRSGVCATF